MNKSFKLLNRWNIQAYIILTGEKVHCHGNLTLTDPNILGYCNFRNDSEDACVSHIHATVRKDEMLAPKSRPVTLDTTTSQRLMAKLLHSNLSVQHERDIRKPCWSQRDTLLKNSVPPGSAGNVESPQEKYEWIRRYCKSVLLANKSMASGKK